MPCELTLMTPVILLVFPLLLTCHPSHLAPEPHLHLPRMSGLNIEVMKQLLADQAKTLLSEVKEQVKVEVTHQLEPHISRLTQLHDEQVLLRKQLSDLSGHLREFFPQWPSTCAPNPTPVSQNVSPLIPAKAKPMSNLSWICRHCTVLRLLNAL